VNSSRPNPVPLQTLLSPIAAEVERVRLRIVDVLTHSAAPVSEHLSQLDAGGGKMLRPALVLLSGGAAGGVRDAHIELAAIVEMIHLASLLHDDVIDKADQRRGRPSANALWGNTQAVLLGDFVLSKAFAMAAMLELPSAAGLLCQTAEAICTGEIRQNLHKSDWRLSEADYLAIIEGKTASLFAACGVLGAMAAGAGGSVQDALRRYGAAVGTAFQITDDVLDIVGDSAAEGKTLGTDILGEKPTLPILHWLGQDDARRNQRIGQLLGGGDVRSSILKSGALTSALTCAGAYVQQAQSSLAILPDTPAKKILHHLATHILERVPVSG